MCIICCCLKKDKKVIVQDESTVYSDLSYDSKYDDEDYRTSTQTKTTTGFSKSEVVESKHTLTCWEKICCCFFSTRETRQPTTSNEVEPQNNPAQQVQPIIIEFHKSEQEIFLDYILGANVDEGV